MLFKGGKSMSKNKIWKKGFVTGVILLLIWINFGSSTGKIEIEKSQTSPFSGSLLGYVNDTSGNPLEGALVIVFFHDTFRLDFSDENGFFHVKRIPICFCMKEVICSKRGYKSEKVSLGIVENTVYDFILTHKEETTRFVTFEARFPLLNLLLQHFGL